MRRAGRLQARRPAHGTSQIASLAAGYGSGCSLPEMTSGGVL